MARPERLRFYCKGTAQVPDPKALMLRGINRCVGRHWQQVAPPVNAGPNAHPGKWTWIPTGKPDDVEFDFDLLDACRAGDLWPADQETADACGVPFDPTFGYEPFQTIADYRAGLPGKPIVPRPEPEPVKVEEAPKVEARTEETTTATMVVEGTPADASIEDATSRRRRREG